jgi:hypothetical protein
LKRSVKQIISASPLTHFLGEEVFDDR